METIARCGAGTLKGHAARVLPHAAYLLRQPHAGRVLLHAATSFAFMAHEGRRAQQPGLAAALCSALT